MASKRRIRRNLQIIAGVVAILLGLVILGAALSDVFGNRQGDSAYESATGDSTSGPGAINPVDPGGGKVGKLRTDDDETADPEPTPTPTATVAPTR